MVVIGLQKGLLSMVDCNGLVDWSKEWRFERRKRTTRRLRLGVPGRITGRGHRRPRLYRQTILKLVIIGPQISRGSGGRAPSSSRQSSEFYERLPLRLRVLEPPAFVAKYQLYRSDGQPRSNRAAVIFTAERGPFWMPAPGSFFHAETR